MAVIKFLYITLPVLLVTRFVHSKHCNSHSKFTDLTQSFPKCDIMVRRYHWICGHICSTAMVLLNICVRVYEYVLYLVQYKGNPWFCRLCVYLYIIKLWFCLACLYVHAHCTVCNEHPWFYWLCTMYIRVFSVCIHTLYSVQQGFGAGAVFGWSRSRYFGPGPAPAPP